MVVWTPWPIVLESPLHKKVLSRSVESSKELRLVYQKGAKPSWPPGVNPKITADAAAADCCQQKKSKLYRPNYLTTIRQPQLEIAKNEAPTSPLT